MKREILNEYFFPVPDNKDSFFAFINLVINNRENSNIPKDITERPKKVGPVKVLSYTRNEANELFMVTNNLKDHNFLGMIADQFCLLRTHWNTIQSLEEYPNASKY